MAIRRWEGVRIDRTAQKVAEVLAVDATLAARVSNNGTSLEDLSDAIAGLVQSVDGMTGDVDLSATYHPFMSEQSAITNPTGGATVDTEARAAINSILSALRSLNLIGT